MDLINNYKYFFLDEAEEVDKQHYAMRMTPCSMLFDKGILHFAIAERALDDGHVVFKFKKGFSPRLKIMRHIVLLSKSVIDTYGANPYVWNCSLEEILSNKNNVLAESEITPLFYTHGSDIKYDYLNAISIEERMHAFIVRFIKEKKLKFLIFESYPPKEFYLNMARYMHVYSDDNNLRTKAIINYDQWHPVELYYDDNDKDSIYRELIGSLEQNKTIILQGPPGTGKSYNIAKVAANYLSLNKKVCVTTMANKGVMELILQDPLKPFLEKGKIAKSCISVDEKRKAPYLQKANSELLIEDGMMLCLTNYQISKWFSNSENKLQNIPYDLVIIEEASQAFLTTIASVMTLGKRCMIVGDPMQLPPIVVSKNRMAETWGKSKQINGLSHFVLSKKFKSYRITTSFRLTSVSANQTGVFYSDSLKSVKKDFIEYNEFKSPFFPNCGGTIVHVTAGSDNEIYSDEADHIISYIIKMLETYRPKSTLAVISPFKVCVTHLQQKFATDKRKIDLTVESVDRIQGMTVDYAIYYIPLGDKSFALDTNRFNVATSRSLSTTLILTDSELMNSYSCKGLVRKFLERCSRI